MKSARDIVRPAKLLETRNRIIRVAMSREGMRSQRDLGEQMGVEEGVISGRFRGRVKWDIDELRKLDMVLHFRDDELLKLIRG